MVGPLGGAGGNQVVMPLQDADGRKLTWTKFANEVCIFWSQNIVTRFPIGFLIGINCFRSILGSNKTLQYKLTLLLRQVAEKVSEQNAPTDADDCWFYPVGATDTSGYPTKKLAGRGEANKHGVHRLVYFCCHGLQGLPAGLELAHLCRRGRANPADGVLWGCINPGHTLPSTHAENLSHDLCATGLRANCKHGGVCIWTSPSGQRLWCREVLPFPMGGCTCGVGCFGPHST
jgi:hypothetical protein